MFSGLIEAQARIARITAETGGIRIQLECPIEFDDVKLGDSICVQGCCLTVVDNALGMLSFQAGRETLSKTSLGTRVEGQALNVERSLAVGDRLGGHLVTGHVDGPGKLVSRTDESAWSTMVFEASPALMKQMASKGSITVDGVSLTLVEVTQSIFSVALIPHTLEHTTLGALLIGDTVNLETDLLAKYVQRQLEFVDRT